MNRTVCTTAAALIGMAALPAVAAEPGYPGFSANYGVYLGLPATTPPPGLFGTATFSITNYQLRGPGAYGSVASGNQPRQLFSGTATEILTYVPGFHFLGGDYSVAVTNLEQATTQVAPGLAGAATAGGAALGRLGFHDIQITQFLGYKLGDSGFYVKPSLQVSLPAGTITGPTGLGNFGDPWVTVTPGLGIQYVSHGWSFLNNLLADYNTKNPITGYQTGASIRDEAVLTRTFGRLTIGPAVSYVGQIANDTSSGYYNFGIGNNRSSIFGAGGFIGYDFGPVSLSVRGLESLITTASGGTLQTPATGNGGNATLNTATRRDTASVFGGAVIYFSANFKIPGIGAFGTPVDFAALK